ncbi:MAG: carbamoyl phosphate synthase-like protein [Bacteroidetes bacterium ADurb.Bin397]|nr:MAG: carbamoyl phosphate synthase-like protein [Bacteroidetes bacterium ADurb.Bin397]
MSASSLKLKLHQLFHWEYWPFGIVYLPIYLVWMYYAFRSRSFFFGTASNPTITNGGFLMESKKQIYDLIPAQHYPKTYYWNKAISVEENCRNAANKISFPMIVKPDIGMRGMAIKKLDDIESLRNYAAQMPVDFMVQEYISYPYECGIFYVRIPGTDKGKITGIVSKELLAVTGDGKSTIRELIIANPRFHFQLDAIEKIIGHEIETIPAKGENKLLVPFGNHCRGAKFIDDSAAITEQLSNTIDTLCKQIPGFYFGRMDIKYQHPDELKEGKNFCIIELNGAGSEPTHIYDPKHSIWYAWQEITRHLNYLYQISKHNRLSGFRALTTMEGIRMLLANKRHVQLLKSVS